MHGGQQINTPKLEESPAQSDSLKLMRSHGEVHRVKRRDNSMNCGKGQDVRGRKGKGECE